MWYDISYHHGMVLPYQMEWETIPHWNGNVIPDGMGIPYHIGMGMSYQMEWESHTTLEWECHTRWNGNPIPPWNGKPYHIGMGMSYQMEWETIPHWNGNVIPLWNHTRHQFLYHSQISYQYQQSIWYKILSQVSTLIPLLSIIPIQ